MTATSERSTTDERGEAATGRILRRTAALAAAAALPLLAACDNIGAGDAMGPESTSGQFTVQLKQQSADASASEISASVTQTGIRFARISMDAVEAVNVTLDEVEVQRVQSSGGDGPWVSLNLTSGSDTAGADTVTVDLTDLPTGDSGLTVAVGDLEAGEYRNVRLRFTDAELVTSDTVTLGGGGQGKGNGGRTFPPGTYELFIPSGEQTGIKVPTAGFTIDEDTGGTVTLFADAGASIQNIEITGRGFLMTPVLTSASDTAEGDTTEADPEVDAVHVDPDSASVAEGDTVRFSATAFTAEDDTISGAAFEWSSTDTAVATVDSTGLATGGAEGTAGIVAESEGVADTARLEVTASDTTSGSSGG